MRTQTQIITSNFELRAQTYLKKKIINWNEEMIPAYNQVFYSLK